MKYESYFSRVINKTFNSFVNTYLRTFYWSFLLNSNKKDDKYFLDYTGVKHSLCNYLIQWSRGIPKKLTGLLLVRQFPLFYRTGRFITEFIRASHLSLSWARSIQFIPPRHFPKIHVNIILLSPNKTFLQT
jgi:hypothetical protein